jgi:hypothetical protein
MVGTNYTVASVDKLRGVSDKDTRPYQPISIQSIAAVDFAVQPKAILKRNTVVRRSVRFAEAPPTIVSQKASPVPLTRREAWDDPILTSRATPPADGMELLMPLRYSPPSDSDSGSTVSETSQESGHVKEQVRALETQYALPALNMATLDRPKPNGDSGIFANAPSPGHKRNASSLSSRRGRKEAAFELFFSPIDATKSQVFLSSPTLPPSETENKESSDEEDIEDDCATPRPFLSRPPSAIFVGSHTRPKPKITVDITAEQLDDLIVALAKSQLIQRHVRKHWWDEEDIPDDDTVYSLNSFSTASLAMPAPLFSLPNVNISPLERSESSPSPPPSRPLPSPPSKSSTPSTNIALTDPKIHGSPIRYISRNYRLNNTPLRIGNATFLNVPHDTDVDCTLRVERPSSPNGSARCKILLQAVNQTVEKSTGKQIYLLAVDIDVTDIFLRATLAELASSAGVEVGDICLPSATSRPESYATAGSSTSVDWLALADNLLSTSESDAIVSQALTHISALTPDSCSMQTLALMSALERLKDQHSDFMLIVPSVATHSNGVPAGMRVPWLSQRLRRDWYGEEKDGKFDDLRNGFVAGVVESVTKRTAKGEGGRFETRVRWGEDELVVGVVRLGGEGTKSIWVGFVRGEFDLLG